MSLSLMASSKVVRLALLNSQMSEPIFFLREQRMDTLPFCLCIWRFALNPRVAQWPHLTRSLRGFGLEWERVGALLLCRLAMPAFTFPQFSGLTAAAWLFSRKMGGAFSRGPGILDWGFIPRKSLPQYFGFFMIRRAASSVHGLPEGDGTLFKRMCWAMRSGGVFSTAKRQNSRTYGQRSGSGTSLPQMA